MELWDLLDREGNPLGIKHVRGEDLPKGTYHRTVEIFTVNSQGKLLVTLRDPKKEVYPGLWEVTGGSVVTGEDSLNAAIRELREETGILAAANGLIFLKSSFGKTNLNDIYLTFRDLTESEIKLQDGETVDSKWVAFDEFESMMEQGIVAEPVCRRYHEVKDLLMANIKNNLKNS